MQAVNPTSFVFQNRELDTAYLQQLYQDEPAYASDMFGIFVAEIDQRLSDLSAAIAANDATLIYYHVHRIKTLLGVVGITKAQLLAQQLQSCSSSGNREKIFSLYARICTTVNASMTAVKQELTRLKEYLH